MVLENGFKTIKGMQVMSGFLMMKLMSIGVAFNFSNTLRNQKIKIFDMMSLTCETCEKNSTCKMIGSPSPFDTSKKYFNKNKKNKTKRGEEQ